MTSPGRAIFPPAGLQSGEQEWAKNWPHGFATSFLEFVVPFGWRSTGFDDVGNGGGSLVRGEPGTPDGAVITFSRPDHVYADPCAHTLLDPPPGPSIGDLAAALAAIPGTDLVSGPTDVRLNGHSAKELVLRVPEDIGCEPGQFYLWADECVTTHVGGYDHLESVCLERPEPRPARARGSMIRLWILFEDDPVLIAAETYAGASPTVEREVQQVIDSIVDPPGGVG